MIESSLVPLIQSLSLVVFDFDGVFTTNEVIVSQDGTESVICNRSDGYGMRLLEELNLQLLILSTEVNPVVQARANKLKLDCIQGCESKGPRLEQVSRERDIPLSKIAFVGNDVNDVPCLRIVGVPIVVADAFPEAKKASKWVLRNNGGRGAIRELCEQIYRVRKGIPFDESPWHFREKEQQTKRV